MCRCTSRAPLFQPEACGVHPSWPQDAVTGYLDPCGNWHFQRYNALILLINSRLSPFFFSTFLKLTHSDKDFDFPIWKEKLTPDLPLYWGAVLWKLKYFSKSSKGAIRDTSALINVVSLEKVRGKAWRPPISSVSICCNVAWGRDALWDGAVGVMSPFISWTLLPNSWVLSETLSHWQQSEKKQREQQEAHKLCPPQIRDF